MALGSQRTRTRTRTRTKRASTSSDPSASSSPNSMGPPAPTTCSRAAASAFARHWSYYCCRRGVFLPSALSLSVLLLLYLRWRNFNTSDLPSTSPTRLPRFYSFEVVNEFPHDPNAFTQGLVYGGNETLFESTGLYKRSSVRQVLLQSGKVQIHHQMDGSLFGEGLTLLDERLFQVTWLTKTGFIYDRYNFSNRKKFTHQMRDGWGLATDGKIIFGSDGSSTLYHLDPKTLKVVKRLTIKYNNREVFFLNELEYINGEVWANVWQTDCVARISPEDGTVSSWIFLHGLSKRLLRSGYSTIDVLNGIAWDEDRNRLFVTGKLWPKLYEIKLHPVAGPPQGNIEDLCPLRI